MKVRQLKKRNLISLVTQRSADEEDSVIASIYIKTPLAKALVEGQINGIPATCLIDTGSSNSYVNLNFGKINKLKTISKDMCLLHPPVTLQTLRGL